MSIGSQDRTFDRDSVAAATAPVRVLPVRVLIVEDDVTMEPLWRYMIEVAAPGAQIEWTTSSEVAEAPLRTPTFDLVIDGLFKKPLDPSECIESVRALLRSLPLKNKS